MRIPGNMTKKKRLALMKVRRIGAIGAKINASVASPRAMRRP
jgi:hypothetical protein